MQGLQSRLGSLSDAHVAATLVSMRSLYEEVAGAQGVTVAPAIDTSIVPGRYRDVVGLQSDRFKQPGPRSKSKSKVKPSRLKRSPSYQN